MNTSQVDLLSYLSSKTQIDFDSFDIEVARELAPQCIDCTSNQFEYYNELAKPSRKELLRKSIQLVTNIHDQFPALTTEELTVEVAAVYLAMEIVPIIPGDMHLMSNPRYAHSKQMIFDNGKRYHQLSMVINPSFDTTRLVMKVPATWEGLQACRELKAIGIKTLATTVFAMEQAVLAGEVGCISISPFVHELKAFFDATYKDTNPLLELCVKAQRWYNQQSLKTKVKACATMGLDELLQLAGVAALTIVPDDLQALRSTRRSEEEASSLSLFTNEVGINEKLDFPSYIDDEAKYCEDFGVVQGGNAPLKLEQAIAIFCDFQEKAETIVKSARGESE